MRRLIFLFVSFFAVQCCVWSQELTWTKDIAPIIYEHCSSCHHQDAIAPFTLMNYIDVVAFSDLIHHAVEEREMPPWPANPDYVHFKDEALLTDQEITDIKQWIHEEMPYGDPEEEPDPPIFLPEGSLLERIDFTLAIPPYSLQSNTDELRWFTFENTFEETIYIKRMEVMPGLENVVHHLDLFVDFTDQSAMNDAADPLPGFGEAFGYPNLSHYINAWQPGANILEYPENWVFEVAPGGTFVIEVHYGPYGEGQIDSSYMNFEFMISGQPERAMKAGWLMNHSTHLVDGPLVIPADEKASFHQITEPLTQDISVIAICPHMHFLGDSYKIWYESSTGDSVPMIDIDRWDFHWQKYYAYQQIFKLPQGARLMSEASYDNTLENHDNPNNPPITVGLGPTTEDEMMLCYFIYADYMPGDENIVMDSTLLISKVVEKFTGNSEPLHVYPNPVINKLNIGFSNTEPAYYRVLNLQGEIVLGGRTERSQLDLEHLAPGVYIIEWLQDKQRLSTSFVKQ